MVKRATNKCYEVIFEDKLPNMLFTHAQGLLVFWYKQLLQTDVKNNNA